MTGEAPTPTPATSTSAPIPTDASAAQAEIQTLKGDPAFMKGYLAGDANAVERWQRAHRIGYPEATKSIGADGKEVATPAAPTAGPAAAEARIGLLKQDAGFVERMANGDKIAIEEWRDLHRQAFPTGAVDPNKRGPQTIEEVKAAAAGGDDPNDPLQADGLPLSYRPATPADYDLDALMAVPGEAPTAQAMENASNARTWMATAKLPAAIGASIAKTANDHAAKWLAMPPAEREAASRDCHKQLRAVWRDGYDGNIRLLNEFFNELRETHPEIGGFFVANGLNHNPMLIMQLVNHAKRLDARARRAGRAAP